MISSFLSFLAAERNGIMLLLLLLIVLGALVNWVLWMFGWGRFRGVVRTDSKLRFVLADFFVKNHQRFPTPSRPSDLPSIRLGSFRRHVARYDETGRRAHQGWVAGGRRCVRRSDWIDYWLLLRRVRSKQESASEYGTTSSAETRATGAAFAGATGRGGPYSGSS